MSRGQCGRACDVLLSDSFARCPAELKEQQHRKGERDMGFRVENKILDDRTIEKIRIRAKMSSIVAAINAKEKLEEHSLMARRLRPENYYESEDFSDLKKGLDGIFNIKVKARAPGIAARRGRRPTVLCLASPKRQTSPSGCFWQRRLTASSTNATATEPQGTCRP